MSSEVANERARSLTSPAGMSTKVANERVHGQPNFARRAPRSGEGEVRMVIIALDYKSTEQPLSCSRDGKNMEEFAKVCNVRDVTTVYNDECTRDNVLKAIKSTASRCRPDDFFVFYFAGHGVNVQDVSGDEADGQDEAFVLVDGTGAVSLETVLIDDDFAEALLKACSPAVRVLVIADCCHSGSITDLESPKWKGREAVSISGCRDNQTSGDTGKGGIFTHSMLLAAAKLFSLGHSEYSFGAMYNAALAEADTVFHAKQHIEMQTSPGLTPDRMAWPLLPAQSYMAPLQLAADVSKGLNGAVDPATMQQVSQEGLNQVVAVEEYIAHVTGADLKRQSQIIACARSCSGGSCGTQ